MFSSGIVLTSFDELINIFVVILLVISSVYYVIGLTLNHFDIQIPFFNQLKQ